MSDRVNIDDIQAFLRFTNVEDCLKNNNEKDAYKKYRDTYHKLLDAEYKKQMYQSIQPHFKCNSQKAIDNVKEIVELDKEIQRLESQLEYIEQSKLFQNIHHRVLYGRNSKLDFKDKIKNILRKISQNKNSLKFIGYFLLLFWIYVIGNIVMNSYSGILTKIFFVIGVIILFFYIVFNYFSKDD